MIEIDYRLEIVDKTWEILGLQDPSTAGEREKTLDLSLEEVERWTRRPKVDGYHGLRYMQDPALLIVAGQRDWKELILEPEDGYLSRMMRYLLRKSRPVQGIIRHRSYLGVDLVLTPQEDPNLHVHYHLQGLLPGEKSILTTMEILDHSSNATTFPVPLIRNFKGNEVSPEDLEVYYRFLRESRQLTI